MRNFLCHFLLLSLLFLSIDGAIDMAEAGHAHTDHASAHAEHEEATDIAPAFDADHCEHCCHGHVAGITSPANSNNNALLVSDHQPDRAFFIENFGQAPPNPPPTA